MKNRKYQYPEIIIECANSHSGNQDDLEKIVNIVTSFKYPNKSIKFQVFSPATLALKDFSWYNVYEEISFTKQYWEKVISKAHNDIGKVWLDIFDRYGVDILHSNLSLISGIKLQASVLENYEVRDALSKLELKSLSLILNISGFNLDDVVKITSDFQEFSFKEVILQIGFQSYPTAVSDTSLQKISVIKSLLDNKLCMADHADAESSYALDIPVLALAHGCSLIEKHICLERTNTKYDYYSSLHPDEFNLLFQKVEVWMQASTGYFISSAEHNYLEKTVQIPIANKQIQSNQFVKLEDIKFRRTSQTGLTYNQIKKLQAQKMILKRGIDEDKTFTENDFSQAKIGVIVAGRLKSSRLKRKAVLPIKGQPSIEMCLENCLRIPSQNIVILATSTLSEDEELKNFTLGGKVHFFQGDPEDVISRYLGASEKYGVDVIIRVTADCPMVAPEIAEILLKSHFETGADYTAAKQFAVGTSLEIINVQALQSILNYFGRAELSEYMTCYFQNNPEFFKLNYVDLPSSLIRDYRLTLDFQEDLEMFEKLCIKLDSDGLDRSLTNIFQVLDENQDIVVLNSHIQLKYKADQELINKLNSHTKMLSRQNDNVPVSPN